MAYHSSITGRFVTKEFAEANPETTVKLSHVNLREELVKFLKHIDEVNVLDYENDEELVDEYLKERK